MNNTHSKPIFSVIMPMYNVEKTVASAIDSVLAQTYPQFELVCVDDGCTDTTVDIVKTYDDPRIRIVHQENRGLSAARNTGINHSSGLYVALLDSDDLWAATKLQSHLRHFRDNPKLGVSYSASQFIDDAGEDMGIGQHPKLTDISPSDIFCRNPIGNGSAAVLRRSMLTQLAETAVTNDGVRTCYFDENLRQSEDVDFWLRAALKTQWQFSGIAETLTLYRVNAGGLSANLDKQFCAWQTSVEKNWPLAPDFFDRTYSLAAAYQKRYLARRAIQSRNSIGAIKLTLNALHTNWRILKFEPSRTLITLTCAVLSLLPSPIYNCLEDFAMHSRAKSK